MRNRLNEGISRIQSIMYRSINEQVTTNVDFYAIANKIITEIEGGYFHPNMVSSGRVKDPNNYYRSSGETMFGMDRKTGLAFVNTPEGKEFWSIIDNADAKNKWAWRSMGNEYEGKLRVLATKMIQNEFNRLLNKYVKDKNIINLVNSSAPLSLNFIYATWNGEGYFRQMAELLVSNYNSGIVDPNVLIDNQINFRLNYNNGLIRKSGEDIKRLIEENNYKSIPYEGQVDPEEAKDEILGLNFMNRTFKAALQKGDMPQEEK